MAGIDIKSFSTDEGLDLVQITMSENDMLAIAHLLQQTKRERGIFGEQGKLIDRFASKALRHFGMVE